MNNSMQQAKSPATKPAQDPSPVLNGDRGDLLARYVRRSACATAAGLGALGFAGHSQAAVVEWRPQLSEFVSGEWVRYDPPQYVEFLQKSLVDAPQPNSGGPDPGYAPIELLGQYGSPTDTYPFRSIGWMTEGFNYQYGISFGNFTTAAFGIDIDFDGYGDINFFRGDDYLHVSTDTVGFYSPPVDSSGSVRLLSNDFDNPGITISPSRPAVQGFSYGEVIGGAYNADYSFPDSGDFGPAFGNDRNLGLVEGAMRYAGHPGDWDNNNTDPNYSTAFDNYGNKYADTPGIDDPSLVKSYVGFAIELDGNPETPDGFGWIEVIVRDGPEVPGPGPDAPEIQLIRWAYTDDGSPIRAGTGIVPEPTTLALLAAGAGACAFRRKKV